MIRIREIKVCLEAKCLVNIKHVFYPEVNENFHLSLSVTSEGFWAGVKSHNFFSTPSSASSVVPLEWNSLCFAHGTRDGSAVIVHNGEVVMEVEAFELFDRGRPLPGGEIEN